jgi:predicted DNA-binding transcriptional regulator AlpA
MAPRAALKRKSFFRQLTNYEKAAPAPLEATPGPVTGPAPGPRGKSRQPWPDAFWKFRARCPIQSNAQLEAAFNLEGPPRRMKKLSDQMAYPPRGMRAARAAAYLGMSESSFLALVNDGLMPPPIKVRGMTIWDRHDLDDAFERMKPDRKSKPRNTVYEILGIEDRDDDRS